MSLLSGLDSHERNPRNKWGRYSSALTTIPSDHSDHSSDHPENDEVCLLTLSPPARSTTRSSLRNLRQRKPPAIEIDDDKSQTQLRSNIDKNPKDFHLRATNFTIPKTTRQTDREKSLHTKKSHADNGSVTGAWLQSGSSSNNANKKTATQIQFKQDAHGRSRKRTNGNDNDKPLKLRRSWLYAETPKSSDGAGQQNGASRSYPGAKRVSPQSGDIKSRVTRGGRLCGNNRFRKADTSLVKNNLEVHIVDLRNDYGKNHNECERTPDNNSEELVRPGHPETPRSRYTEEIRCILCNDVITKLGECLICPKTSDEELSEVSVIKNSDEISEDGFLVPVKRTEPPGAGFITSQRETEVASVKKDANRTQVRTREKETTSLEQVNVDTASESRENDFVTKTSEAPKSSLTQDDIFCSRCGQARSNKGCGCSKQSPEHLTDKFYSRSKGRSSLSTSYSGIKYGGACKVKAKRKRSSLTTKKNTKAKQLEPNQTTIDGSGETKFPDRQKTTGRKKKIVSPKQPVCVHISSDEEEIQETTGDVATSNSNDIDASNKEESGITYEPTEEVKSSRGTGNVEEKPDVCSSDETIDESGMTNNDFVKEEKVSSSVLENQKSSLLTKRGGRRHNNSGDKLYMNQQEEESYVFLIAKCVLVGSLFGQPTQPVEVREDRIIFKITRGDEDLEFKLEKNNLASFKIHSECPPLVVILTPTPGWARKYVERYRKYGIFIDPGSKEYIEKQIVVALSAKVEGDTLDALVQLIDQNLSDEPIVKKMSDEEAKVESQRIVSEWEKKHDLPPSNKSQSTNSSNDVNDKSNNHASVIKTYSTRSKSSEIASVPKEPPKKILVYQPSNKSDGVTITSEDMSCLEPSTYLNDTIIDFFLKYLIEEKLTAKDKERIHVFSTFFYQKLTQKNTSSDEPRTPTTMHRMVKSWTKNVDIFSKDFLVIPINEHAHWYLVIVCFPHMVTELAKNDGKEPCDESTGIDAIQQSSEEQNEKNKASESDDEDFDRFLSKTIRTLDESKKRRAKRRKSRETESPIKARPCILVFDSLGSKRRASMLFNLKNYLNCEWKERKDSCSENLFDKDTLKGCYPKVPCQVNFSDCGLYVLQYFESFFTNPIEDYTFPIDLRSWFSNDDMATKRQYITEVIYELRAKAGNVTKSGDIH